MGKRKNNSKRVIQGKSNDSNISPNREKTVNTRATRSRMSFGEVKDHMTLDEKKILVRNVQEAELSTELIVNSPLQDGSLTFESERNVNVMLNILNGDNARNQFVRGNEIDMI